MRRPAGFFNGFVRNMYYYRSARSGGGISGLRVPPGLLPPGKWSRRWDLNPEPDDYKTSALPIELHRRDGLPLRLSLCVRYTACINPGLVAIYHHYDAPILPSLPGAFSAAFVILREGLPASSHISRERPGHWCGWRDSNPRPLPDFSVPPCQLGDIRITPPRQVSSVTGAVFPGCHPALRLRL